VEDFLSRVRKDLASSPGPGAAEPPWPEEVARAAAQPGRIFGRYILASEIGRGSAGRVWKAWQRDIGRWVALKFLEVEDASLLTRFTREARAAGRLRHPNIVAIYEVGELDRRHYIAMEWLDAGSLEGHRPDPRTAAEIVRTAARAIHFAHEHGIVHRDLKPANLLRDSTGRVCVADFGLARDLSERLSATISGVVLGTPHYMAPEQAAGRIREIDARTDVYGLGATLYDLLTGRPPHGGSTVMDVLQSVLTRDPAPVRMLAPAVPRELAAIVEKAMAPERHRRYPSASAFADDLDRFLAGDVVLARPVPFTYRARRQIQRRPLVSALVVLLALTFVAALFAATRAYVLQRRETERLRARAALDNFTARIDSAAAELARRNDDERLAALYGELDRLAADIAAAAARFPGEPALWELRGRANLLRHRETAAVADFTRALEHGWTRALLWRARARLRELPDHMVGFRQSGARARRNVEQLMGLIQKDLAAVQAHDDPEIHAWTSFLAGNWDEVERLCSLEIARGGAVEGFFFLCGLSRVLRSRLADARADFAEAIARNAGDARVWFHLGNVHLLEEKWPDAAAAYRQALRLKPDYALAWNNLGYVLAASGDTPGAIHSYDRALALDPNLLEALVNRANVRFESGDAGQALADYDAALARNPKYANAYYNRSLVWIHRREYDRAIADLSEAIRLDGDQPDYYRNRGICRQETGDLAGAEEDFTRAIEADPDCLMAYIARGVLRLETHRIQEAIEDFSEAIRRKPDFAEAYNNRGVAYKRLRRYDEAIADYTEALRHKPDYVDAYRNRGTVHIERGDWPAAIRDFDEGLAIAPDDPDLLARRGTAREGSGDLEASLEDYDRALERAPADWPLRERVEEQRRALLDRLSPEF
jgi:serine/threonine-protein kinase